MKCSSSSFNSERRAAASRQVMNPELRQKAVDGDVSFLNSLQNGDSRLQIILESAYVGVETPLHVALRHEHIDFAMKILDLNSALAGIPDEGGFYPLHLAAARGYVNVVNKLLHIDRSVSCLRDNDGGTALSAAALNEKEGVLKALYPVYKEEVDLRKALVGKGVTALSSDLTCKIKQGLRQALAGDGDDGEELILHLCVVNNKLKSVKALVELDEEVAKKQHAIFNPYKKLVQKKDANGNTALHYAAAKKNPEMLAFLKGKMQNTDVKITNKQGLTATNIEKEQYTGAKSRLNRFMSSGWDDWYKKDEKWTNEMQNALMLLATLIVTVAFQVGVSSPPGGFWQDEEEKPSLEASPAPHPRAGTTIHNNTIEFRLFMYFNMIAFAASLTIILSLVSGFPLKHRSTTWILVISIWIALTSMALAFVFGTEIITLNEKVLDKIPYVLGTWMGLVAIVLSCHCVLLVHLLVEKIKESGTLLQLGWQWMLGCNKNGTSSERKTLKKDEERG